MTFWAVTAKTWLKHVRRTQGHTKTCLSRTLTAETSLSDTPEARVRCNPCRRCRMRVATKWPRVTSSVVIPRGRASTSRTTRVWVRKTSREHIPVLSAKLDSRSIRGSPKKASTLRISMVHQLVPCSEHPRPTASETRWTPNKVTISTTRPSTKAKNSPSLRCRDRTTPSSCRIKHISSAHRHQSMPTDTKRLTTKTLRHSWGVKTHNKGSIRCWWNRQRARHRVRLRRCRWLTASHTSWATPTWRSHWTNSRVARPLSLLLVVDHSNKVSLNPSWKETLIK